MIDAAKAALAGGLSSGIVMAVGESATHAVSDPTVMVYSLAAGAMALVTLLVKDKIAPAPPAQVAGVSGKDLIDRIERLAYGVDEDRSTSRKWRDEVTARFDLLQIQIGAIEVGVDALRVNQEMLADESEVASWRSDKNGQCVWASQALQRMTGYSFADGFEGTNWINVFPHDEAAHIQSRWSDAVKARSAFAIRTTYQHKDGSTFAVQLRAECLPDGTFRGVARKI